MITIENLVKKYRDFELNVSLEIPDGQVCGLVGKNGAGKSTTIKSILGLVRPDSGKVIVMEKNVADMKANDKQNIGVALAESGFSGYLTVNDVIAILKNMYDDFDEDYFRHLCIRFDVPLGKVIREFSTGMKAKVRVLSAISHRAKLLIMDEPTSDLDVEARNDILDILREYLKENEDCSILISSHISSDLENLCDDIYLIHEGKIILHEDTDRILSSYAILKVDEKTYEEMDRNYILKARKESYGYRCLTDQKQFYIENYPEIVVENGSIDDLILMLTGR
ncbi:MAG: ABC transporter ATP-binding protein [Erysipelotrichaceae bacterium]|nr:ABC transporter ATP-binding protein [Erysipelotrichaceae bacterium]MBR6957507.1 ABC transporter ATP-binding protein [Erysipelotrichaceae bacterium]